MPNSSTTQPSGAARPIDLAAVREAFNARSGNTTTIRLSCGALVLMDRHDHDRISASFGGAFPTVYLNRAGSGHVYARLHIHAAGDRPKGNNGMLARLVLSPGPGQVVRYRDRNSCNLTRTNLYLTSGRSGGREAEVVEHMAVAGEA